MKNKYLRPFIKGYSKNSNGHEVHNHVIAMSNFRESFNKDGYFLSPLLYPEGHGILNPVTVVYKNVDGKIKKVSRINWKRHPEELYNILK